MNILFVVVGTVLGLFLLKILLDDHDGGLLRIIMPKKERNLLQEKYYSLPENERRKFITELVHGITKEIDHQLDDDTVL